MLSMNANASRLGSIWYFFMLLDAGIGCILIVLCYQNVHKTFSLVVVCCFAVDAPTPKHIFLEHLRCKTFHLQVPLIPQHKKAQAWQNTSWSGLTGDSQAMKHARLHQQQEVGCIQAAP